MVVGTENEHAVDISKLRAETGYITLDDGYGNTGLVQVGDHLHRRREGHPPLPRHPDRAAGRAQHLSRDRLAADLRRTADRGAAPAFPRPAHRARDDPRGALQALRRVPGLRPPDGHSVGHDQRDELLRAGDRGDGAARRPSRTRRPGSSARCGRSRPPPTRPRSASRSSTRSRTSTTSRTSCT